MITVRMAADLPAKLNGNETLANVKLLDELRRAGIPALGTISLRGVARGSLLLRTEEGLDGDELVYSWVEQTPSVKPVRAPVNIDDEL